MEKIYGDKPQQDVIVEKPVVDSSADKYTEIIHGINLDDSIVYLIGEISEYTFYDLCTKCRTLLRERPEELSQEPITIVLNSSGGCMFEMFAIIDYIQSLKVKVNVIVRGQAMSAAGMILACATGSRICSKHSTIMLHQPSGGHNGKNSDIQASADQYKKMEEDALVLLAKSTNKDVDWWRGNTKTDMFVSAEEALELGLIDLIG